MVVIHGKVNVEAIKKVAAQILRELQQEGGKVA
jgi:hypothetical protein